MLWGCTFYLSVWLNKAELDSQMCSTLCCSDWAREQDQTLGGDTTVIPMEEEGFVLKPIEESGTKEWQTKQKLDTQVN